MVKELFRKPFFISVLICLFVFYSGFFKLPDKTPFKCVLNASDVSFISGMLISSPVKAGNGKNYSAKLRLSSASGKLGLNFIKSSASGIINVYIPSQSVEAFFPGKIYSKSKAKGSFFYEAGGLYAFEGRLRSTGFYVSSCKKCLWPENLTGILDHFRGIARLQFKRLMYSFGEAGGLLLALLSGAREYTITETSEAFKNAGLSHILALSGMHLSMFSAIALFFGNKFGRKKLVFIIRSAVLVIFVWFAGFSPSLLRAFICSMLIVFSSVCNVYKPDMTLILCFSFLLQCIISPSDLSNPGFMLSYTALAGILLTNKYFYKIFSKFLPQYVAASLSASTGAQLFTLPVSLKLFGSFAPAGIIATLIVSPLVTVFIYSGLCTIFVTLIFPVILPCSAFFINIEYNIIKFTVKLFSHVPVWRLN